MSENENVKVEQAKHSNFGSAVKEWFRKKIVSLKRKPHIIPLVLTLVTSVMYLICLRNLSITITDDFKIEWGGLAVFINCLLSVLVLALFLSAFPKRKKPNKIFIILVFVFYAVMIGMDILYYINTSDYMTLQNESIADYPEHFASLNDTIAHIVLLAICVVSLATLPLYSKLIRKINTRKEIASSQLNEEIDTTGEE